MFTGSNATAIRRMQSADEIAMQTAARFNRDKIRAMFVLSH